MLTPKKSIKLAKDNEVTVFENGTVLGSVLADNDTKCSYAVINQLNEERTSLVENYESRENSCSPSCSVVSIMGCTSLENVINPSEQSVESVANESVQPEILNCSTCSHESRQSKRLRRKFRKCNEKLDHFPPQYTAIYLDAGPQGTGQTAGLNQIIEPLDTRHMSLSVPTVQRLRTEPVPRRVHLGLFRVPSVPFVIGILALGGVACTLGGIVLGSTGLVEQSTQYLSAALLMIGIGVSLLVISGAIWKLTIADEPDSCPCCRHLETCRNCNSMFCNNRILPGSYIYPEFQHRTPPPSYVTSLNECAVGLLVRETTHIQREPHQMATPPPSYRSYSANSLSLFVPVQNLAENQPQSTKLDESTLSDKEPTYVELE